MSEYLGGGTSATPSGLGARLDARPGTLLANPILAQINDDAASDRYTQDPVVSRLVAQAVNKVPDFMGIGIAFRSSTGAMRQVRLPAHPGDLTLFVLFGSPPSNSPAAPPPGASNALRHEAIVAGLGCAAAA